VILCLDNDDTGRKADLRLKDTMERIKDGLNVEGLNTTLQEQLRRNYFQQFSAQRDKVFAEYGVFSCNTTKKVYYSIYWKYLPNIIQYFNVCYSVQPVGSL